LLQEGENAKQGRRGKNVSEKSGDKSTHLKTKGWDEKNGNLHIVFSPKRGKVLKGAGGVLTKEASTKEGNKKEKRETHR